MAGARPRRKIEPRIDLDHRRMLNITPEMSFNEKMSQIVPWCTMVPLSLGFARGVFRGG